MVQLPVFKVGTITNKFMGKVNFNQVVPSKQYVKILFPTRLNTMVLDQTRVLPNNRMIASAGEVAVSIGKSITVETSYLGDMNGNLKIPDNLDRKVLVFHAYHLMCNALSKTPSLRIDVHTNEIVKHSGLGLSGAILGAVCASINELFDNPITNIDLLRYIASNYGEETNDDNTEYLQTIPCFGGSIATGLIEGGFQVIAGEAVPILTTNYDGFAVIGLPLEYVPLSAKQEVDLHVKYLFEDKHNMSNKSPVSDMSFNEKIAYKVLNQALPKLKLGDISEICNIAFDINFRQHQYGVNDFDWFFPRGKEIANNIRFLFENKLCDAIGKSSTGPMFYALARQDFQIKICFDTLKKENMNVMVVPVHNGKYIATYS